MPAARRTSNRSNGRRYLARRDHILDIAVSVFRSKGFAGTSMRDIGHSLERTKGSLYYYFPDKEEILYQCHDRALEHLLERVRIVRRRSKNPEQLLRNLIEEHVAIMVHEFHGTALALEVGSLGGKRLDSVVRRRDRYERILRGAIREGVKSGVFRDVDVKLTAFAILGSINWIAQWYREPGATGAEEIGRFFADLHLNALRPMPKTAAGRKNKTPRSASRR